MTDQKRSASLWADVASHTAGVVRELVRPHPRIQDEESQENARLLSALLLTAMVAVTLIIVLVVYYDPDDFDDLRTLTAMATVVVSLVLYVLNRVGGYTPLATFGFLAFLTVTLVLIPYADTYAQFVAFAAVPMLLVGMFCSFGWTLRIHAVILIVMFLLNTTVEDETIWDRRMFWYFLLFASVLVLAFKEHHNRLEAIRRRRLAHANSQLQATLRAIPDLLLEIDRTGRLLDYRIPPGAELPISLDDYRGLDLSKMFLDETVVEIREAIAEAARTGRHAGATFSLDFGEERQWYEVSISAKEPVFDGKEDVRFVVVARNITERRHAEFLRSERTRLELALEKEKELAQVRSQLLSTIAHEFRTPLTVILTSSSLLVNYADRLSPASRTQKIQQIVEQVSRLDTMLDDVSTLSKNQRGFLEFRPQPVAVVAFCDRLVDELKSISSPNNELVFEVQGEFEPLELDLNLLRHALTNLISNAIKYSPDGGAVTLSLARTDDHIVFRVRDEGLGIPQEHMQYLFQPFHRANNVTNIPGSGLGLSIVQEVVYLQGGEVSCESTLGVGTIFTVRIPIPEGPSHDQNTDH